jgi:serine/threonine-protein kinase ULK4
MSNLLVKTFLCVYGVQVPESNFDTRALPVDPLLVVEFVKLQPEQLEKLLNCILASIQGNTTMNEKLNILKYLESLCTNLEASNILINGPLMPFLVKML